MYFELNFMPNCIALFIDVYHSDKYEKIVK